MKRFLTIAIVTAITLLTACGGGARRGGGNPPPKSNPLDPQGNWLFSFDDGEFGLFQFAGQLYELNPPVVTSNTMGPLNLGCNNEGSLTASGQASGTDVINLTITQTGARTGAAVYTLTGTIAPDQAHMSGTWASTDTNGCTVNISGPWTAQLLGAVTGTWTGDLGGFPFSATLAENTDQTSTTMGQVTGTVTWNSGCFTGPLDIPAWSATGPASAHSGIDLLLRSAPDSSGATLRMRGIADTTGKHVAISLASVTGGPCDGQAFNSGQIDAP